MKNKLLRKEIIFLICIGIGSFCLYFFRLGHQSLSLDEVSSYLVSRSPQTLLDTMLHKDRNMWLYYSVLAMVLPFGNSEVIMRLPSVIFAVGGVLVIYFVTRSTAIEIGLSIQKARLASCISACLLALNTFYITYAQDARSYSLFVLLILVSHLFFLQLLRGANKNSTLVYILVSISSVYAHLFSVVVFAVQCIFLYLHKSKNRKGPSVLDIFGIWFVGISPLPITLFISSRSEIIAGTKTVLEGVTKTELWDLYYLYFSFASHSHSILVLLIASVIFVAWTGKKHFLLQYHLVILLITIPVLFIFSLFVKPIFVQRYFIYALPSLLVMSAIGVVKFSRKWHILVVCVLLLFLHINAIRLGYLQPNKPDMSSITKYVHDNGSKNDLFVFIPPAIEKQFRYYEKDRKDRFLADLELFQGEDNKPLVPISVVQNIKKNQPKRVWVIYRKDLPKLQDETRIILNNTLMREYTSSSVFEDKYIRVEKYQFD